MLGYTSPKTAAKNQRREQEKMAYAAYVKIAAAVTPYLKEGETVLSGIKRLLSERVEEAVEKNISTAKD